MSKNTNKIEAAQRNKEVVNLDKVLENQKTSGTNLQAYMRSLINSRGSLGE